MSNPRFSCTFDGRCVPDPDGSFTSEEECLANCGASSSRDTDLIIYQYNPELAVNLAPDDRRKVIKLLTGITVIDSEDGVDGPSTSIRILLALSGSSENPFDLDTMVQEPQLYPYLIATFPEDEFIEALTGLPCPEALLELDRRGHFEHYFQDTEALEERLDENGEINWSDNRNLLNDGARRLFKMVDTNMKRMRREFLLYLEERDHPLAKYIVANLNRSEISADLTDHVTDRNYRHYQRFIDELEQLDAYDHHHLNSLWRQHDFREAMLRKHPEIHPRIEEICQNSILRRGPGRARPAWGIAIEYDTLAYLAKLGRPQELQWCINNIEILDMMYTRSHIRLCLSGTANPVERLESLVQISRLVHLSSPNVRYPNDNEFISQLIREALEFQSDYIPSGLLTVVLEHFWSELYSRVPDDVLISYARERGGFDIYEDYVNTLPVARRVRIKKALKEIIDTEM